MTTAPRLVILVGLPGSGKTDRMKGYDDKEYEKFDDFLGHHKSLEKMGLLSFLDALENGLNVVANDIFLTQREERTRLQRVLKRYNKYDESQEWIYYENNPKQCIANVKKDGNRKHIDEDTRLHWIKKLSPVYEIPEGAVTIPVYAPREAD